MNESKVTQFIGYLSSAVPELHTVSVPSLVKHWETFKEIDTGDDTEQPLETERMTQEALLNAAGRVERELRDMAALCGKGFTAQKALMKQGADVIAALKFDRAKHLDSRSKNLKRSIDIDSVERGD